MSSSFDYQTQQHAVRQLGACLKGGTIVETPFDLPVDLEQQGDLDQTDDAAKFSSADPALVACEELPSGKKDISDIQFKQRLEFFLDGSLRTKFICEYIHGATSFPILATDLLCAVVNKRGRSLRPHHVEKRIAFIFPEKAQFPAKELVEDLEQLNKRWIKERVPLRTAFLSEREFPDTRNSMLGKARECMHRLEHRVAAQRLELGDKWLVMDGSIRKEEFLQLENTIGVAKSFSPKPIFDLGGNERRLSIASYLSRIGVGERSAVFTKDRDVAFWYVRLRNFPPMEPLGGIVKIDFSLKQHQLSGDRMLPEQVLQLIEELSAEIYANRTPSIYPYPRWPSFLYPIRLAEQMMRSNYTNVDVIGLYGKQLKQGIMRGVD
jgi:hypothetical protein